MPSQLYVIVIFSPLTFVLREVFSALTSLYTFIITNKNKKKRQVVKLAFLMVKLVISLISSVFFLLKQESEPYLLAQLHLYTKPQYILNSQYMIRVLAKSQTL